MAELQSDVESNESRIELVQWAAFILLVPSIGEPTLHLVGLNQHTGRGRVSSPIEGVHEELLSVRSQSGRVYDLVGESGASDICLALIEQLTAAWAAAVISDVTGTLFEPERRVAGQAAGGLRLLH